MPTLSAKRCVDAIDPMGILFASTAALSVALLGAQWVDWRLSRWALSATFFAWLSAAVAAPFFAGGRRLRRIRSSLTSKSKQLGDWAIGLLASVGLLLALGHEALLGLIRIENRWSDLVFNIDHRYLLMHAWSILRYGGADQALSMAGTPISYHSGPAWFAAAAASTSNTGPDLWLLLWFPLAAISVVGFASLMLSQGLGINPLAAVIGAAIAFSPLWSQVSVRAIGAVLGELIAYGPASAFQELEDMLFAPHPTMMLNALLGLAIMLVNVSFFVKSPSNSRFLIANAASVLIAVAKPQYAISALILLFALGVALLRGRKLALVGVPVIAAFAAVGLADLTVGGASLSGLRSSGWAISWPDTWTVVDPFLPTEIRFLVAVLLVVAGVVQIRRGHALLVPSPLLASAVALLGIMTFWALLNLVASTGSDGVDEWAWNAMQAARPVTTISLSLLIAAVLHSSTQAPRSARLLVGALIAVAVTSSATDVIRVATDPSIGHEATDTPHIRRLLTEVDPDEALLLVSDLSDPAQDHARPGAGFYLSNTAGHQYWLTETRGHAHLRETARRTEALTRFFATRWSSWHEELLATEEITHVAISRRCPAMWDPSDVIMLTLIAEATPWTLYEVGPPSVVWGMAPTIGGRKQVGVSSDAPAYGRAACR